MTGRGGGDLENDLFVDGYTDEFWVCLEDQGAGAGEGENDLFVGWNMDEFGVMCLKSGEPG